MATRSKRSSTRRSNARAVLVSALFACAPALADSAQPAWLAELQAELQAELEAEVRAQAESNAQAELKAQSASNAQDVADARAEASAEQKSQAITAAPAPLAPELEAAARAAVPASPYPALYAQSQPGTPLPAVTPPVPPGGASGVQFINTGQTQQPAGRGLTVRPGISLGLTGSDNIDLLEDPLATSGGIVEVTPFVQMRWRNPDSTFDLNAALRGQRFFDSELVADRANADLSGSGDIALAGDGLRLRGSGGVFRIDDTGLSALGQRSTQSAIYRNLTLSPYLLGRIGSETDYEAGYEYQLIDRDLRSDGHRVFGELQSSGLGGTPLGYIVRADGRTVDYDNGFDYTQTTALLGASWSFGGRLRVGAGAYWSAIDQLVIDGDDSSIGPAVFWEWRATERTTFQGQVADTYHGEVAVVQFRQLFSRWLLAANYQKGVQDGNESSAFLFRPIDLFRDVRRPRGNERVDAFQTALSSRDLSFVNGGTLFLPSLQAPLIDDETLALSTAFIGARNAMLLTLFRSDRSAVAGPIGSEGLSSAEQYGLYATFDRLLTRRTSVRLVPQYLRSNLSNDQAADYWTLEASLGYRLTPQADVRFALRRSVQNGENGAKSFNENAATVVFTYQFQ